MTNNYQHTYHGDAADYAAELADYYKQQQETAAYLINDYKAYRDIIGDEEADSQIASIRARLSALNSAVQLANTHAKYWSQFENEADYSAAMFDEKMYEQHGQSDYQALSQTVKDNETTIQTAMDPYVVNAASAQNDWLEDQAASIATADDYRILKKETEDEYSAVSELYNEHDTSAENMEIYNQKQALEQKLDDIDAIITEKEKQEYYAEMAAELYELPKQLMGDLLNIPYLEDEKIQLIGAGTGDYAASFDSDNKRQELNARKEATKQQLRDLGYSDKEIEGFIIYAGLVHDKEQYEAHMAEKQAYAEAHPLYASIGSVLENFFEPMESVDSLSQKIRNALRGEYIPINEYSQIKQHTDGVDVTRDTVAGKIEDATGSELLTKLYEKGMSTADIVAQNLATGGVSSLGSLGKGLIAVAKSFGDDFLRTFIKTYGDDAVRAIAAYGDDAAKLALNNADDATKLLLSSGDDLSRTALSSWDDIGKLMLSSGDDIGKAALSYTDDASKLPLSSGDDFAKTADALIKRYGKDAARALTRILANNVDNALPSASILPSTTFDAANALEAASNNDDFISRLIDNWNGETQSAMGDAMSGSNWDDVISDALAGKPNAGYNGSAGAVESIDKLLKQSQCSSDDFYKYLNRINSDYADTYIQTGKWPSDVQIPKSSYVLKADGAINWDEVPNGGYILDDNGNALKERYVPDIGEIIDRYGPNNGRFTSPIRNNKPYSYSQRSLPYLENPFQYHQYRVTGDLSNIEQYYNQSTDVNLKQMISAYMKKYRLSFSALETYSGNIASGFGEIGGGEQYELPLPVDMLEGLGLITEF